MTYPLDPLAADEFTAVAAILRREHGVGAGADGPATSDPGRRTASIELVEPTKTEPADFDGRGPTPAPRAEVICVPRANNATYKGVAPSTDDCTESSEHIAGVQANFAVDEFLECDELVRSHPDVIAAVVKRGITDMDPVFMDSWVTPNHPDERWPAGEFVDQSSRDTGFAEWTKANRNIDNTDVVGTPPDTCHPDSTSADH